jgi:hypothetical protein
LPWCIFRPTAVNDLSLMQPMTLHLNVWGWLGADFITDVTRILLLLALPPRCLVRDIVVSAPKQSDQFSNVRQTKQLVQ